MAKQTMSYEDAVASEDAKELALKLAETALAHVGISADPDGGICTLDQGRTLLKAFALASGSLLASSENPNAAVSWFIKNLLRHYADCLLFKSSE